MFPTRTLLLAGAAVLLPTLVQAADVTPAQASAAETQVRDWLGAMLGPSVKIADRPIRLTPAGDHFDLSVPIRAQADATGSAIEVTGTARPLDGGKWSVENVKTAMPLRFTINMPMPPKEGSKETTTVPVTYTINLAGQDGQLMLDPSFATPTTWTTSAKGGTVHTEGGVAPHDTTMGATSSVMTLRPAGPDRVDLVGDGTIQDYGVTAMTSELGKIQAGVKLMRVNTAMTGVSRTQAMIMSQSIAGLFTAVMGGTKPSDTVVMAMLGSFKDFASEMTVEEQGEGFAGTFGPYAVNMAKIRLGFGAKSDAGLLQAHMELGADGLALPGMPLGELVPTQIAFRPFVSGVGVAELSHLVTNSGTKEQPEPADIAAIFARSPITTGIESMSVELGGATFTGSGKLVFTSPEQMVGDAQITAEDFDELMEKVSGMPGLAQAVPVLAFIKGIGKTVDDKLVWNVTYRDGKALVNNVDLTAMAGGGAPKPAPRGARPAPGARKNPSKP